MMVISQSIRKRGLVLLIHSCFVIVAFTCSSCDKNKPQPLPENFLDEIVEFHFVEAKANQYSINEYLQITKPYGVWDIRPRSVSELDIHGQTANTGEVSFYHFGLFSAYFEVPEENVMQVVDTFFENLAYKEPIFKENASLYKSDLETIANQMRNGNCKICIFNKHFKRVDDLFYENDKYWKYDIPQGSPFHISTKKVALKDRTFDDEDWELLKTLEMLGLYGAVYQNGTVIIMIDGLLNYSYGYIVTEAEPSSIDMKPLFHFQELQKVNDDPMIYYYLSN